MNQIKIIQAKTKLIKNLNELARIAQTKKVLLFASCLTTLLLVAWIVSKPSLPKTITQETTKVAGAIDPQFTESSSQKALEEQQNQIKNLNEQLEAFSKKVDDLQKSIDEDQHPEVDATQDLQLRLEELENSIKKTSNSNSTLNSINTQEPTIRGITTTNFSYTDTAKVSETKTVKDYVPSGTFAKAVLLSGADTNAGVHGQGDTAPITMRILDNGTLPNGEHSSLKGCFVTAAAYPAYFIKKQQNSIKAL